MHRLLGLFSHFFDTATPMEVALATIGIVTLATALIGWGVRALLRRRAFAAADGSGGSWLADDTIVFPAGRGAGEPRFDIPPPRVADDDGPSPISSIFAGGLDELATGGDRIVEAVREHPLSFVAGALAAGFAAGMIVPIFSTRNRIAKLLDRLVEANEALREHRAERNGAERSQPERLRQSRPT